MKLYAITDRGTGRVFAVLAANPTDALSVACVDDSVMVDNAEGVIVNHIQLEPTARVEIMVAEDDTIEAHTLQEWCEQFDASRVLGVLVEEERRAG